MISLRHLYFLGLLVLLSSTPTYAVNAPSEQLTDSKLELRAQNIGKELRCLVCQNESIEDSSALIAQTLRKEVRSQIQNGKTDAQIHLWMREHYGDYIELSPPLSKATIALWATPFIATIIAGLILLQFKKRKD